MALVKKIYIYTIAMNDTLKKWTYFLRFKQIYSKCYNIIFLKLNPMISYINVIIDIIPKDGKNKYHCSYTQHKTM